MSMNRRILAGLLLWTGTITALHLQLNVDWSEFVNDRLPEEARKLHVAYIPVT